MFTSFLEIVGFVTLGILGFAALLWSIGVLKAEVITDKR